MAFAAETIRRIRRQYFPEDFDLAVQCLRGCRSRGRRTHSAVLSLAQGDLAQLVGYVALANDDWRDVLCGQETLEKKRQGECRRRAKLAKGTEKVSRTDDAFLEAILQSPDEDAPRLMYADWLVERGDRRGEYLRLLCQWCQEDHSPWSSCLVSRERQLRRGLDGDWLAKVRGIRPVPFSSELLLTASTIRRLKLLFTPEDREEAARLLAAECGNNLPFLERATPRELDRFRYAALRLSGGNLSRLRSAIALAQTDWRDLLMAAGFGNDVNAHRRWLPAPRPDTR